MKFGLKSALAGIAIASVTLAGTIISAQAQSTEESIKYRKSAMTLIGGNAGYFFAILQGNATYDAEQATLRATNLQNLAGLPWEGFGSEPTTEGFGTTAAANIWSDADGFEAKRQAFLDAVANLAAVAGSGDENAVKAAAGQMGGTCSGCHDDYRTD